MELYTLTKIAKILRSRKAQPGITRTGSLNTFINLKKFFLDHIKEVIKVKNEY